MKKIFLLFVTLLCINSANAYQIVYPAKKSVTINSPSSFFIGHTDENETLKINGQIVKTNDLGYFAHTVKLNSGENIFVIIGRDNKEEYKITVPKNIENQNPPQYINYDELKYGYINSNNTPLRSTPVNYGINRMSHLQKGVNVYLSGEYSGFYKVFLSNEEFGWIDKNSVELTQDEDTDFSTVFDYRKCEDKNFDTYEFYLMKKVPYKIEENPFKLTIFNLKNSKGAFSIKPHISDKLIGYKSYYEGDKLVLKIRKFPKIGKIKPLDKLTIVIDGGHGGSEAGAIGCSGAKEKDINLIIAKYLQKELIHLGANVILTREDDSYLGLYDRVKITNDNDAQIFVSIHANATIDSKNPNEHSGTSVYYYYDQAKPLAENILSSVNKIAETNNDGIHQESFAVVRNTEALSVLVETAYMINPDDIAKLEQPYFQRKIAKGIALGILNYFKPPSEDKKAEE